jgi:hypothetical protein
MAAKERMAQTNPSNSDAISLLSPDDGIAVVELADELQIRKQTIFKVMRRLGIQAVKRRESDRRGQLISVIRRDEADVIRNELRRITSAINDGTSGVSYARYFSEDSGVFYVVQLEPVHDPGRLKVGFTTDIDGRLRHHRCSAPFAQCIGTWPCRRTWERAAIDCATIGAEQIHTEVFRVDSVQIVIDRANKFFSMMPAVPEAPEVDSADNVLSDDAS